MKLRIFKIDESRFTSDYNQMLTIIILNSLGFFFLGFWISIVAGVNMGASKFQIALVIVSYTIGRMISGFYIGIIADRIKSRTTLVLIGSFGRGISYFIIYTSFITNHILLLGIGYFILGHMAGIFWVPFNMFVAEKSSKDHRSQAYGMRDSINAVGQIIGGTFGFTLLLVSSVFTNNPIIIYSAIPIYGIANFIAGIIFYRKVDESIKFSKLDNEEFNNSSNEISQKKKVFTTPSMIIGAMFLITLLFPDPLP